METLGGLKTKGYGLLAECSACGKHSDLDLQDMIRRYGADVPVPELAHWVRYPLCGSKEFLETRPKFPDPLRA